MKTFAEVDKNGVCIATLTTTTKPVYPIDRQGVELTSSIDNILGGHYNGKTIDKCPAGKVWDVVTKKFIKIPAV